MEGANLSLIHQLVHRRSTGPDVVATLVDAESRLLDHVIYPVILIPPSRQDASVFTPRHPDTL